MRHEFGILKRHGCGIPKYLGSGAVARLMAIKSDMVVKFKTLSFCKVVRSNYLGSNAVARLK